MRVYIQANKQDVRDVERLLADVPNQIPRVFAMALNKTATKTKGRAARLLVAAGKGLKLGVVRKHITISRATRFKQSALVTFSNARIPLINLTARQTRAGVTYSGGEGRKLMKGAFIQTMPSGHVGVFKRRGAARLPITEQFVKSVAVTFAETTEAIDSATTYAAATLSTEISRALDYVLEKRRAAG